MRIVLKRVLSWLRWPSAAACVIAAVLMLVSVVRTGWLTIMVGQNSFDCGATGGCMWLLWETVDWDPDRPYVLHFVGWTRIDDPGNHLAKWWTWRLYTPTARGPDVILLNFPAWCLVLLLAGFSWTGFRAKRRLPVQLGQCPRCRHLLAGAAVCPECGTKVSGEIGADDATRVA